MAAWLVPATALQQTEGSLKGEYPGLSLSELGDRAPYQILLLSFVIPHTKYPI